MIYYFIIRILVHKHTTMTMNNEKEMSELSLKKFTERNFEAPSRCRNIDQIRFYISELCSKIKEYEQRFNDVPGWAYVLLAQYNHAQNKLVYLHFRDNYSLKRSR